MLKYLLRFFITVLTVIIPVYNEANMLPQVLVPLAEAREAGLVRRIIVSDDGSTDGTSDCARECGAEVVRSDQNRGKLSAFMQALPEVDTLILLSDADMLNLTVERLEKLLARHRPGRMTVAPYWQGIPYEGEWCGRQYSGFRLIDRHLLAAFDEQHRGHFLIRPFYASGDPRHGYTLEEAINYVVPKKKTVDIGLLSRERGGGTHGLRAVCRGAWWGTFVRTCLSATPKENLEVTADALTTMARDGILPGEDALEKYLLPVMGISGWQECLLRRKVRG